jgi:hypothetical protein
MEKWVEKEGCFWASIRGNEHRTTRKRLHYTDTLISHEEQMMRVTDQMVSSVPQCDNEPRDMIRGSRK